MRTEHDISGAATRVSATADAEATRADAARALLHREWTTLHSASHRQHLRSAPREAKGLTAGAPCRAPATACTPSTSHRPCWACECRRGSARSWWAQYLYAFQLAPAPSSVLDAGPRRSIAIGPSEKEHNPSCCSGSEAHCRCPADASGAACGPSQRLQAAWRAGGAWRSRAPEGNVRAFPFAVGDPTGLGLWPPGQELPGAAAALGSWAAGRQQCSRAQTTILCIL